jgi:hypothetical protein
MKFFDAFNSELAKVAREEVGSSPGYEGGAPGQNPPQEGITMKDLGVEDAPRANPLPPKLRMRLTNLRRRAQSQVYTS